MPDPDDKRRLGYVVLVNGPSGPDLATKYVFGTKHRAENYVKTIPAGYTPRIVKVNSESEREAHRWG